MAGVKIYKDFIKETLKEAAEITKKSFGKVTGVVKKNDESQIVTETDIEVGKFIIGKIQGRFPSQNIINEESGGINKNSNITWVIDPIDGTSNYAKGIPLYGIIIGILENNFPIAGGVVLPCFEEIYLAEKGTGAFCNEQNIEVTKEDDLHSAIIAYATYADRKNPEGIRKECQLLAEISLECQKIRQIGCIFDGMMVAKGKYGGYLTQHSKIWDIVGYHAILEEAGGITTDFYGKPIDYSNPFSNIGKKFHWCTAAPLLHGKLQEIINHEIER